MMTFTFRLREPNRSKRIAPAAWRDRFTIAGCPPFPEQVQIRTFLDNIALMALS